MLEHDDRKRSAAELIATLPCEVELPAQWLTNFDKQKLSLSVDPNRRYPRVHCRSERNRAGLLYEPTLPRLPRPSEWRAVYVVNVSREGVCFLHGEAMYPCEQVRVILLNGQRLKLEVIRCRRLESRCFEVGCRITGRDDETSA